jgi:hypothetical protein
MECRTLGIHISEIFAQFAFLIERHHVFANFALVYMRAITDIMAVVGTKLVRILLAESDGSNLDE